MKFKRTKIQTQASKKLHSIRDIFSRKNVLVICLLCSRELPLPCCGLRCSCGSMQAVAFCTVDQNVSIVMAFIISTQWNLAYSGFGEALVLE